MLALVPVILLALSAQASVLKVQNPRYTVTGASGTDVQAESCAGISFRTLRQVNVDLSRSVIYVGYPLRKSHQPQLLFTGRKH